MRQTLQPPGPGWARADVKSTKKTERRGEIGVGCWLVAADAAASCGGRIKNVRNASENAATRPWARADVTSKNNTERRDEFGVVVN